MLLSDGRLNKQIAGDLDVAEATVKAHVTAILRKLKLYRRTQAAVLAQRLLVADAGPIWPGDAPPAGFGEDEAE
jgi:DNA-binding NarL/FixJ family response regulator